MIDANGYNDACYPEVVASLGALSIGLVATFPEKAVPLSPDADMLRRNPQLFRRQNDGGFRIYHPSFSSVRDTVQFIQYDRWVDWSGATKCELVFRRKLRAPFLVAARFGERQRITFNPPRDEEGRPVGKYAYVNLDFWSKTDEFAPLYLRVGDGRMSVYLSVSASLKKGMPVAVITQVRRDDCPRHI